MQVLFAEEQLKVCGAIDKEKGLALDCLSPMLCEGAMYF